MPEGGPGEARHLLAPVVVGHARHGHCRRPGIRPAWRTGHRPVLTSLRICKSCRQALNGSRERSMQETAHHRDQPDKDREYLRPPRAPQVPFAAAPLTATPRHASGLWSPAPAARGCTKTLRKHSPPRKDGEPLPHASGYSRPSAAAGGLLRRSSSGPGTCSSHYRSARAKTPSAWSARHIREARRRICRAHNWTICCIPRDQSSTLGSAPSRRSGR